MPRLPFSDALAGRFPLPRVRPRRGLTRPQSVVRVLPLRATDFSDSGHRLSGLSQTVDALVSRHLVRHVAENRHQRLGVTAGAGARQLPDSLDLAAQLRRAMVRPGREQLKGPVEVDETYLGAVEEGVRGRQTERKALIVIAAEENGKGIGRIRMGRVRDASAASLIPFVEESVEAGSVVHTDGWLGYEPLEKKGYVHRISYLEGQPKRASELLPRVHKAASLLKRWLLGTHQGAVSHEHLDYYLDEFVFRFNRRTSRSRGKLFYRLVQQAVAIEPVPYRSIVQRDQPAP